MTLRVGAYLKSEMQSDVTFHTALRDLRRNHVHLRPITTEHQGRRDRHRIVKTTLDTAAAQNGNSYPLGALDLSQCSYSFSL